MHISDFNALDTESFVSNPSQHIPPPVRNGAGTSYSSMVQGISRESENDDVFDIEDLAIDSEDEDIVEKEESNCPIITLSKDEKSVLRKPWRRSLIIKMFDKQIGYLSLMRKLQAKWSIKGKLTLTDLGCSYYVARFTAREDLEHVLLQGPWMIDDHYLTIRKWAPNFVPSEDKIRRLTTWVRIPNLPVEYFNKEFLSKIGDKIGNVVRIDKNTEMAERGQFTRMSIEVDIDKPLLSKFRLNKKVYHIQYEGLRMICFECGRLGHLKENCAVNVVEKPDDESGRDIRLSIFFSL
ncbi:uncharacterized protein At4g02000-like [Silene latifolia]|uniref:uncharacterized protein At4g02000-like n=1 Tax=Silene latifolia TaxID=37657 RepID=UPI003D77E482